MGVAPKYLRDAICLSTSASSLRLLRSLTGGSSLSLGLGQPWPYLDPFPLLSFLFAMDRLPPSARAYLPARSACWSTSRFMGQRLSIYATIVWRRIRPLRGFDFDRRINAIFL